MRYLLGIATLLSLLLVSSTGLATCLFQLVDPVRELVQVDYRRSERIVKFYSNLSDVTSTLGVAPVAVLNVDDYYIYDGSDRSLVLFDLRQHHIVEASLGSVTYADRELGRNFEYDWSPFLYIKIIQLGNGEYVYFDPALFNKGFLESSEYKKMAETKMAHMHIQYSLVGIGRADGVHFIDRDFQQFVKTSDFEDIAPRLDRFSKVAKILSNEVNPKVVRVFLESVDEEFAIVREVGFEEGKITELRRKVKVAPGFAQYLKDKHISFHGTQVILYPEVVGLSRAKMTSGKTVRNDLILNTQALSR